MHSHEVHRHTKNKKQKEEEEKTKQLWITLYVRNTYLTENEMTLTLSMVTH